MRGHQLDRLPVPITITPAARERLRVLEHVARQVPKLAARHRLFVVGKGGTLLHLCEGVPRPSTDYDCDADGPCPKDLQARMVTQALRATPGVRDPEVKRPTSASQPVIFNWRGQLPDGTTQTIQSHINVRETPELRDPAYRAANVRTVRDVQCYVPEQLYAGKANAVIHRAAARDLYDMRYGLTHHLDRIRPESRTALHDHFADEVNASKVADWQKDAENDQLIRGTFDIPETIDGIIDCLLLDPVVAVHANPGRRLGFYIDADAGTIALGLRETETEPFDPLYTCPHADAPALADFILASRVPIWEQMEVPEPAGGTAGGRAWLIGNMTANIERQNAIARGCPVDD